ncbi:unnamed protein product [Symbiodinium microadriaticum]|nr:unnamed protein product [Symbiodinium microadriaticum]
MARSRSSARFTTPEALALHESVSPDRWCVTRSDLTFLRQELWCAVQCGEIRAVDDSDPFESSDDQYGPNIHTVNRQYIMPVTEEAGKVSWALMRHPDGLDCDLFISHAWQEGVFEFLSKVLHSWPAGSRHVWCCMLANPQNLDISSFLQSPSSSPFARALQASTSVLVVPNRHCSIYTRLWCGYEAYCAHEEGKTIFIARASNSKQLRGAIIWASLSGLLGVLCGDFDAHLLKILFSLCSRHIKMQSIPLYVVVVAAGISANINQCSFRKLLNRIGALAVGVLFVHWRTAVEEMPAFTAMVEQHLLLIAGWTLFLLLEVDRVNGQTRKEEAKYLSCGFSGSIVRATCSKQADAARIFEEIGEKIVDVDFAIHVLLAAGMSSSTLRDIAHRGIEIQGAGHAEIAFPFVALVPLTCETLWSIYSQFVYGRNGIDLVFVPLWLMLSITVAARLGLLLLLWRSPRDERCFILKMISKTVAVYLVTGCPLLAVWETQRSKVARYMIWFAVPLTVYTIMLGLACLGMKRLASLPLCGTVLLQLFLARGRGCCVLRSEEPFRTPMLAETESDRDSFTTPEALALHEAVTPDRWCVTRSDLMFLRHEVWRAIQTGDIRPLDDGDPFELSDHRYGPNIYTVNRQYIMPVTQEAGKVSWALMLHPDGLDCDLFISHAWLEGVFEFLSKVLHSWPAGSRHVWCCMLANPQNLDISSYLQSPSRSPFARALQAATCVLVVPNRHCSIYTRLWCGYEAYRAHEEGKTIYIARASNGQQLRDALFWAGFSGACLEHFNIHNVLIFIQPVLLYIVELPHLTTAFVALRLYLLSDLTFFLLLEVDRVNGDANMEEAKQLSCGFSGSIVQASCSREVDAERIFAEIGEKTADVDYAIHVLLSAGMSSPTLRAVAKQSIDIRGAGHAEIAFPFLALVPFTLETAWAIYGDFVDHHNDIYLRVAPFWLIHSITVVARVGLLLLLWRSPRDERCFILKMMSKIVAVYLILYSSLRAVWTSKQSIVVKFQHWFALPLTAYTSMLGLACTYLYFSIFCRSNALRF